MDLGLRGKKALVTAASRGLGLATARALALEGARVALGARKAARMDAEASDLAARGQTEAFGVEMDLFEPKSIAGAVATVIERLGGLEILVINTPGPAAGPFLTLSRQEWRKAIDMIVMPAVDVLHAALPHMRLSGGRVLFITTVGVKVGQPNMVLSNATRLALAGIAKTLSIEHARENLLVNCLCPGPIDTDRMEELIARTSEQQNISREDARAVWLNEVPLGRMGRAEDFGKLAAVMVSDAASFVTGVTLAIDGGKSRAY